MHVVPGLLLALVLAIAGQWLSGWIGTSWLQMSQSPVSAIMVAILLGIVVRNAFSLPAVFDAGIRFGLQRVLRAGIVLLGIRLSLGEVGAIGLSGLPIIIAAVASALLLVTWLGQRVGLGARLGTLIAVGTSVCGATAIVATAPTIAARDDETAYAVACVTLFGVLAMLSYPFAAHWLFDGNAYASGLFLGTSVHETAQVAGAGLVYEQFYGEPQALDVATVTKLVRNLGMLAIIPLMCVVYHRRAAAGSAAPKWYTMVPLFVIGFALMSLIRTAGDLQDEPFGFLSAAQWDNFVATTKTAAELCLAVAMAAVGLGTRLRQLVDIGLRPLAVGLVSALIVGVVSAALVRAFYV